MGRKILAAPLLLLLAAGAAPPDDCVAAANGGQTIPGPLDLSGRPNMSSGLTGQISAAILSAESDNGCRGVLPSAVRSTTLRSEAGEILHGLPEPDILRRVDEPKRAPQFQQ